MAPSASDRPKNSPSKEEKKAQSQAQSDRDKAANWDRWQAKDKEDKEASRNWRDDSKGQLGRDRDRQTDRQDWRDEDRGRPSDKRRDDRGKDERGTGGDRGKGDRGNGDKGKGDKGKGGKGTGSEDRSPGSFAVGCNAHKVDGSRPGMIKIGASKFGRYYSIQKARQILVDEYGFTKDKAGKMCLEVGMDRYDDAALCPCSQRQGHMTADDTFHKFPKDFHQVVRKLLAGEE